MKVKKYVGETIQDTIFKVKADLGSDAIILNTRKYKKGGFLGLKIFGEKKVEVLAALEDEKDNNDINNEQTLKEINDLKNMVSNLEKGWEKKENSFIDQLDDSLKPLYNKLISQGVKEETCQNLVKDIKKDYDEKEISPDIFEKKIKGFIGDPAPITFKNNTKVIAFIGPTGVGKTTTIAKLAAKFSLEDDYDVGMITADTYRIAAVQQLETYSDIMNIPLKVVYNDKELRVTINGEFGENDLIFIDTAGSSWTDKMQLGRLKGFTDKKLVDETHLLLSLNTKAKDIDNVINHFSPLEPDKILLTKIDETSSYGDIINMREKYELPYSYITFGQDVPDDIIEADVESLYKYLIGDKDE